MCWGGVYPWLKYSGALNRQRCKLCCWYPGEIASAASSSVHPAPLSDFTFFSCSFCCTQPGHFLPYPLSPSVPAASHTPASSQPLNPNMTIFLFPEVQRKQSITVCQKSIAKSTAKSMRQNKTVTKSCKDEAVVSLGQILNPGRSASSAHSQVL